MPQLCQIVVSYYTPRLRSLCQSLKADIYTCWPIGSFNFKVSSLLDPLSHYDLVPCMASWRMQHSTLERLSGYEQYWCLRQVLRIWQINPLLQHDEYNIWCSLAKTSTLQVFEDSGKWILHQLLLNLNCVLYKPSPRIKTDFRIDPKSMLLPNLESKESKSSSQSVTKQYSYLRRYQNHV